MATSPGWLYPASGKIPSPRLTLSDFSSSERQTNMLSHISIYNSGGSVKRHPNSREPEAGSRAPPATREGAGSASTENPKGRNSRFPARLLRHLSFPPGGTPPSPLPVAPERSRLVAVVQFPPDHPNSRIVVAGLRVDQFHVAIAQEYDVASGRHSHSHTATSQMGTM